MIDDESGPIACLAMAAAVLRLSPVRRATSSPILRSVYTVRCASGFRVSAMANMATSTPERQRERDFEDKYRVTHQVVPQV